MLGEDDGGEEALTYTWQVVSAPSGVTGSKTPTFSANGTNAAKATTVTFFAPGAYTFCVSVTDAAGNSTPSHVDVTVTSTLTRVDVLPKTPSLKPGAKLHFFRHRQGPVRGRPLRHGHHLERTSGKIDSSGQFTAPSTPGAVMVTASAAGGTIEGTAQVAVGGVVNPAATIVEPAAVSPDPVTGTTAILTALGADDGGADKLRYTWSAVGLPAGVASPLFSANGTNDASNTTVTFAASGLYNLRVTISDGSLSVTSSVPVEVVATPTTVTVNPTAIALPVATKARFTAAVADQFGLPMATQPPVQWSVEGGGVIDGAWNIHFARGRGLCESRRVARPRRPGRLGERYRH